jgi:hypothetical protein
MKLQRVSTGQAIIFMSLVIMILIAFAGLTIDSGNAMEKQRRISAASTASAVAAMNGVILQNTDGAVMETINNTMIANNVKKFQRVNVGQAWGTDPDVVYFSAQYLDASGAFLGDVGAQPSSRPADRGAAHVVVQTSVQAQNTFAKVVGVDTFGVSADGAAGAGSCVNGVYPITYHKIYMEKNLPAWYKPVSMEAVGLSPLAEDAQIPSLNTTNSNSPRFRVYRNPNTVGIPGNFSWTRWNGAAQQGSQQMLSDSLTGAGNLADGFSESNPPPDDTAALRLMNGRMEVGDWLASDTGNVSSQDVRAALDAHITQKTFMILPIHDRFFGQGNSNDSGYHIERFVKVRLLRYDLSPNGYFEFALIQDKAFCAQQVPPPPPPTNGYPFRIDVTEQLQWYNPAQLGGNYDIAVIMDFSYSMRFCWDSATTCSYPNRRIDIATRVMTGFVEEMLIKRNQQQGGENRLAFVTYSQGATQRIPFMDNNDAALTAWSAQVGTVAAPRNIPNSDLPGNTNTASGLVGAVSYLNSARTVDSHQRPVKLAVLLLTDGLTNVFNDAGYQNVSNKFTEQPFRCGTKAEDMDNPYVQSTCPSAAEFPNISPRPLPPIKAMVKAADDARAAKPSLQFFAVVVGSQGGLTAVDMHLNEVAPNNYYMANSPAELEALVTAIEQELGEPCSEQVGTPIPAGGAKVTIAYQAGGTVGTFSTNADGVLVIPNLLPGTYTISIQHMGVIAAQDPLQLPRNYTKMIVDGGSAVPVGSMTVIMPNSAFTAPKVKLVIDDPANAQCPN